VECIRLSEECPEAESREHGNRNSKGIKEGVISCFWRRTVLCTLVACCWDLSDFVWGR